MKMRFMAAIRVAAALVRMPRMRNIPTTSSAHGRTRAHRFTPQEGINPKSTTFKAKTAGCIILLRAKDIKITPRSSRQATDR